MCNNVSEDKRDCLLSNIKKSNPEENLDQLSTSQFKKSFESGQNDQYIQVYLDQTQNKAH